MREWKEAPRSGRIKAVVDYELDYTLTDLLVCTAQL